MRRERVRSSLRVPLFVAFKYVPCLLLLQPRPKVASRDFARMPRKKKKSSRAR